MISLARVDALLAESDPLQQTESAAPQSAVVRSAVRPIRSRRRMVAGVCAGLTAAAAVLAVAVVSVAVVSVAVESDRGTTTPGARQQAASSVPDTTMPVTTLPGTNSRTTLRLVAAQVRTSTTTAPSTVTTRESLLDRRDTALGSTFFRQTVDTTRRYTTQGATFEFHFGPPRFLSARDAARAQFVPASDPIFLGHREQHVTCRSDCDGIPRRVLDRLPTTDSRALLAALHRAVVNGLGGCASGPACPATNLLALLRAPQTSGPLRAAAIEAFGFAPGVTVLGYRTVDGRRGLAIRAAGGYSDEADPQTIVVDTSDGLILSDVTRLGARSEKLYDHRVPLGSVIDVLTVLR